MSIHFEQVVNYDLFMPKPRIREFDLKAEAAAFLKAETRMSQNEIASVLGVSQAVVSRLLDRARKMGCFREVAQFVRTRQIDEQRMREFELLLEHSALAEKVKRSEERRVGKEGRC